MKPPGNAGILSGALVGAMLTPALVGVFYAGWRLADLPFVPFDLFDWIARVLPGSIIELVIGAMVAGIALLHLGPTSVVAKLVEQGIGIANLLIAGVVASAILFGILRALHGRYAYPLGVVVGLISAIPAVLVSASLGKTAGSPAAVNGLWILIVFLFWGMALAWAYRRLAAFSMPIQQAPGQASVERVNRRQFLVRLGGYTATITVSGAVIGTLSERHTRMRLASIRPWSATHALPNADAAVTPAPGTRPEYTPLERHYRIDINTIPPDVDERTWRLKVIGLVGKPQALTLDEIRRYEPMHQFVTLACISNPVGGDLIGTTRWTGVSLKRLLPDLLLKGNASHLKLTSADGFSESLPLEIVNSDERVMLAYAWDGVPLLREHGFPLRVYIPDVYGMKQPKWIESIEAMDHWEPGYWVVRGWDQVARMKATSVIDAVATDMDIIKATPDMRVPIGGIAHAGARGISKVEVRADNGAWQQAVLRTPLSHLTWVVWRFDWPFHPGEHTFTVRCSDGTGAPQITESSSPAPNGASGLFSKTQDF